MSRDSQLGLGTGRVRDFDLEPEPARRRIHLAVDLAEDPSGETDAEIAHAVKVLVVEQFAHRDPRVERIGAGLRIMGRRIPDDTLGGDCD